MGTSSARQYNVVFQDHQRYLTKKAKNTSSMQSDRLNFCAISARMKKKKFSGTITIVQYSILFAMNCPVWHYKQDPMATYAKGIVLETDHRLYRQMAAPIQGDRMFTLWTEDPI